MVSTGSAWAEGLQPNPRSGSRARTEKNGKGALVKRLWWILAV
jgi:hypothetical protein